MKNTALTAVFPILAAVRPGQVQIQTIGFSPEVGLVRASVFFMINVVSTEKFFLGF